MPARGAPERCCEMDALVAVGPVEDVGAERPQALLAGEAEMAEAEVVLDRAQEAVVVVGLIRAVPLRMHGESSTAPMRPPPGPGVVKPGLVVFGPGCSLQQALESPSPPAASASSKVTMISPWRP